MVGGLIVAFLTSWRLSLVMTAFAPLFMVFGLAFVNMRGASTRANLEEEAAKVRAGGLEYVVKMCTVKVKLG